MRIGKVMGYALAGAGLAAGVAIADDFGDPSFSLPREVVSAAAAFEQYMRGAAQVDPGFPNGEAVARGLKAAAAYEPAQLEEGMIGYGAIVALQDDRFAERLIEDPLYVTRIDGAAEAAQRIAAAIGAEAAPVVTAGAQVKSASYSIQRQAWSRSTVADAQGRLASVKALSQARTQPNADEDRALVARLTNLD